MPLLSSHLSLSPSPSMSIFGFPRCLSSYQPLPSLSVLSTACYLLMDRLPVGLCCLHSPQHRSFSCCGMLMVRSCLPSALFPLWHYCCHRDNLLRDPKVISDCPPAIHCPFVSAYSVPCICPFCYWKSSFFFFSEYLFHIKHMENMLFNTVFLLYFVVGMC